MKHMIFLKVFSCSREKWMCEHHAWQDTVCTYTFYVFYEYPINYIYKWIGYLPKMPKYMGLCQINQIRYKAGYYSDQCYIYYIGLFLLSYRFVSNRIIHDDLNIETVNRLVAKPCHEKFHSRLSPPPTNLASTGTVSRCLTITIPDT